MKLYGQCDNFRQNFGTANINEIGGFTASGKMMRVQ